jgi:hypothetical protein
MALFTDRQLVGLGLGALVLSVYAYHRGRRLIRHIDPTNPDNVVITYADELADLADNGIADQSNSVGTGLFEFFDNLNPFGESQEAMVDRITGGQ